MIKNYWILWKRMVGILLSLVFIFTSTACNLPSVSKPEIISLEVENNCNIRINYIDHVTDGYVFLRRSPGDYQHFHVVKLADKHGESSASFLDEGLPGGSYFYEVGFFNSNVTKYSKISAAIVIGPTCGNAPLVLKTLNPILLRVEVIDKCTARIWAVNYADNATGIRYYRSAFGGSQQKIADLPLAQWNQGAGAYDDKKLHNGTYRYQLSSYDANGESFSDASADVVIADKSCNSLVSLPTLISPPINLPTSVATVTMTPTAVPIKACTWQAVINIFVRKGPGSSVYPQMTAVEAGTQFPIVGQSEDGQFWVVELHKGLTGYVPKAEKFSRTDGDCSAVSTVQDPPPPPTPIPTMKPREIPQCSDGIDNDGDGAIDMRDSGCSNLNDTTEN